MQSITLGDMVLRLAISLVLGGVIGFEREAHDRPAGLRTHILVCMGSTLMTLCSYAISQSVAGHVFDPGRITAQIVTGIGFLGAGTILHHGNIIRGLTTAASIWTVAGIGIAVGIGGDMLYLAAVASVLVYGTLTIARRIEDSFLARHPRRFMTLTMRGDKEELDQALAIFAAHGVQVQVLGSRENADGTAHVLRLELRTGPHYDGTGLNTELATNKNIASHSWD